MADAVSTLPNFALTLQPESKPNLVIKTILNSI